MTKLFNKIKLFFFRYNKRKNSIVKKSRYMCPICGYPELLEPPFYSNGGGSYEICPSCGFEFGYDDCNYVDYSKETYLYVREQCIKNWRKNWVEDGMKWNSKIKKPNNWDPQEQLNKLIGRGND